MTGVMRLAGAFALAVVMHGALAVSALAVTAPVQGADPAQYSSPSVTVTVSVSPPASGGSLSQESQPALTLGQAAQASRSGPVQPRFRNSLLNVLRTYMAEREGNGASFEITASTSAAVSGCLGRSIVPASVQANGRDCVIEELY